MRQGLSASLLALVVTFGTVVGAQLGRDSIAEIKPLFFRELPDPPAVIDDQAAASMQLGTPDIPQGIAWGYPYYASARPVCWGCPGKPEGFADPYYDPADAPIPTNGHAVVRRVADIEATDEAAAQPLPRAVERYMTYPVSAEEARRLARTGSQEGQSEQTIGM